MDARRAKIVQAQLVKRGFSQEKALQAVSLGPDAIAALSTAGPCRPCGSAVGSAMAVPEVAAVLPATPALPAVDISWMYHEATAGDDVMVPEEAAVFPATPALPAVDIAWMYHDPTAGDDDMAREMTASYANESGFALQAFQCQCCMEDVPEMTGIQLSPGTDGCDHVLCLDCFKRLITGRIEQREPCTCPLCPQTSPSLVPDWLVLRLLGKEMATEQSSIEQMHLGQADGGRLRLWQCPTPDCANRFFVDEGWNAEGVPDAERVISCTSCRKMICVRCNVEEHEGFSCQQFKEWRRANDSSEESYAELMRRGLIKPCPNCAAPILKNDGCNFMTCPTCNDPNRMCWQTGKKRYGPDGCGGGHSCH